MIRLSKPVQLLEWGAGTSSVTMNWSPIASGTIRSKPTAEDGITTLVVQVQGAVEKKNLKDDSIKVVQQGEGMTPRSDVWGEVAFGRLQKVASEGGQTVAYIEIKGAAKYSK